MKFTTSRENLLIPLQQVIGVIEKRQTLPILSNVLITLEDDRLEFTGTDLEVQLVTHSVAESGNDGGTTVPARKLLDICRQLPDGAPVTLEMKQDKLAIQCARSRFSLSSLPADNYPQFDSGAADLELSIPRRVLKKAMEKTLFAMAQQDVRYYLNGLLLEVGDGHLRTVSSDGHRLAIYEEALEAATMPPRQIIIPRKGILELYRLLDDQDEPVSLQIAPNNIRVLIGDLSFAAKLIEGRFPDYQRVMPKEIVRVVHVDRDAIKASLTRVSVLSNEKFRGINLELERDVMRLSAQNPEHEEAQDEVEITLEGEPMSVSFNATYLVDAVNNIDSDQVRLSLDATDRCLIEDPENSGFKFIVSPMRG